LPQIAKIATYAGFADPNFWLQQRAQKKNLMLAFSYIYKAFGFPSS